MFSLIALLRDLETPTLTAASVFHCVHFFPWVEYLGIEISLQKISVAKYPHKIKLSRGVPQVFNCDSTQTCSYFHTLT